MNPHRCILAAAFVFASSTAFAQTAAPAPSPAPQTTAAGASTLTKDGKPRMKIVRAQCRDTVKGENLKGDARKQAMADCIIKQRPDMEPRIKCAMDPSLKDMDKDARRAAVKVCVQKAKG